jgi:hypothetical protein
MFVKMVEPALRFRVAMLALTTTRQEIVVATHILLPAELRARLSRAALTLAQREAEKVVKQRIAARGIKLSLSLLPRREILAAAQDYLIANPQLIAEQGPVVERWRVEGFFGKRAARAVHFPNQCVDSPTQSEGISQ